METSFFATIWLINIVLLFFKNRQSLVISLVELKIKRTSKNPARDGTTKKPRRDDMDKKFKKCLLFLIRKTILLWTTTLLKIDNEPNMIRDKGVEPL